jgi:hypothetical protein
VVAESALIRHQLLILNRGRKREGHPAAFAHNEDLSEVQRDDRSGCVEVQVLYGRSLGW